VASLNAQALGVLPTFKNPDRQTMNPAASEPVHWKVWPPNVPHEMDPGDQTLWDVFSSRAEAAPSEVAIHFLGQPITWQALLSETLKLAGALQGLGLGPGDRVLLFSQNCPQFVAAFHAVIRCGAVVVPANPMNKSGELAHCIADSGARIAIAATDIASELTLACEQLAPDRRLTHLVVFDTVDIATLDVAGLPAAWQAWLRQRDRPQTKVCQVHPWSSLLAQAPEAAAVTLRAEDLVLVMYTSGTTGMPKGCMHSHRTLLTNAMTVAPWQDMRPGDVSLVTLPMFHITGLVAGMLGSIYAAAKIVLLPRWDRLVAAQAISSQRVSHWANITTMVIDLLSDPTLSQQFDFSSLRSIGGGGATMPQAVHAQLKEQFGLTYIEGYGLTETAALCHTNPRHAARAQCLGIPHVNTRARVVDPETLQEVATGEMGEIIAAGPQLFLGYWQRPLATAEAFVEIDGTRWFRTGDLGRVDDEGYFYIADRLKRMINASGFKVWPAEVEAILHSHPAIAQACVIARRDAYRGESVKAVVVLRPGERGRITPQDIIDWAREHMAAYKYPRQVEFVDKLPLTGTGKVLWRELQAREDGSTSPATPAACTAPTTH